MDNRIPNGPLDSAEPPLPRALPISLPPEPPPVRSLPINATNCGSPSPPTCPQRAVLPLKVPEKHESESQPLRFLEGSLSAGPVQGSLNSPATLSLCHSPKAGNPRVDCSSDQPLLLGWGLAPCCRGREEKEPQQDGLSVPPLATQRWLQ